jgi:hypothetical protein
MDFPRLTNLPVSEQEPNNMKHTENQKATENEERGGNEVIGSMANLKIVGFLIDRDQ